MTTIHAKEALLPTGWAQDVQIVVEEDGRIGSVGAQTAAADHLLDLALPAPLNLHSHSFQRAMAGLTERRGPDPRDSFWTWRALMYRFLDQLSPDQVEAIAALVFMEMLEAGYAGVAEFHYLHHGPDGMPYDDPAELAGRIVAGANTTGIGLTLLPVLYQFGGCDRRPLLGGQKRFGNTPETFAHLHAGARRMLGAATPDAALGVAPHSLRAVDPDGIALVQKLRGTGPVHMHLAEQVAEVEEVRDLMGARPVEYALNEIGLDENWCLIHCTQMNAAEVSGLAKSGAVVGLCPITESSLGDGVFEGAGFLEAGGRFGIGSDSNVHISLFDELRTLEYSQRLRDHSRAALATSSQSTGRVLFEQAAANGARAGGRAAGALQEGLWADILGIKTDNYLIENRKGDVALDTLIFGGRGASCVNDVWSAGRHLVRRGRHVAHDAIVGQYRKAVAQLLDAL